VIVTGYSIPGYTVLRTSDGMCLLVPQPRIPISVDFVPMPEPEPEPESTRWITPRQLGGVVPVRPRQVVVLDPTAIGIKPRRRSQQGFAPPRKRPKRIAKRIAARSGRMHYPKERT